MPLVLYLKSHHQTQGHLGFLLRYLLEVWGEFFLFFWTTQHVGSQSTNQGSNPMPTAVEA